jgi:hypothetical protein
VLVAIDRLMQKGAMRFIPQVLLGSVLLAGCAGDPPPPPAAPAAAPVPTPVLPIPAPAAPDVAGYAGAVLPIPAPLDLGYAPTRYRTSELVSVSRGGVPAGNVSTEVSGELRQEGDRMRAELVTERIFIDGKPSENAYALLVQDIDMDRKGQGAPVRSHSPNAGSGSDLPPRYRLLEPAWRDRLPAFSAAPVMRGAPVFASGPRLSALQRMLADRPYQLEGAERIASTAVGMTPCSQGQCLLVRTDGSAQLVAEGRSLGVSVLGYALVDPATGLVLRARDTISLENPAQQGAGTGLHMTIDTETILR